MASYAQQGSKRQKVREVRSDNVDYFQGVEKFEYNNVATPSETGSYRHYNVGERVHGRPMEDWLKLSVSFSDFRSNGSDALGRPTHTRSYDDGTSSIDNNKRNIKALFDLMAKLGVKYWTAFDSDLLPSTGDSWDENRAHWDEMVEYIQEMSQRYHVKLLWLAPDLHSHPRYASGAMTNPDASIFIQAASQTKRCLEMAQRLNAECFLLWPYREGYDSIFQTDLQREIKLFSKLLKMTADYKERINYRSQLLIMPYYNCRGFKSCQQWSPHWRHDLVNYYMWDVTSCLFFLKNVNLDRFYKVCCPPGHHMFMANVYNMLGGAWLSSDFDCDNKTLTLMMKSILDQGTIPPAGINLRISPRRERYPSDARELVTSHARCVDAVARALRVAAVMASEQAFSKHLQQRYATYYSGFGARLLTGEISMEECEEYHKKNQPGHNEAQSCRGEHLEAVFQRCLDACDRL